MAVFVEFLWMQLTENGLKIIEKEQDSFGRVYSNPGKTMA